MKRGSDIKKVIEEFVEKMGKIKKGMVFGLYEVKIKKIREEERLIKIDEEKEYWIESI
jgi:hypothetical protein